MLLSASVEAVRAVAGIVFALAWVGWGTLWLLRYLPAAKGLPAVVKQPLGLLGLGLLVLGAAGFAGFAGNY